MGNHVSKPVFHCIVLLEKFLKGFKIELKNNRHLLHHSKDFEIEKVLVYKYFQRILLDWWKLLLLNDGGCYDSLSLGYTLSDRIGSRGCFLYGTGNCIRSETAVAGRAGKQRRTLLNSTWLSLDAHIRFNETRPKSQD